jgi:hypothetical protein
MPGYGAEDWSDAGHHDFQYKVGCQVQEIPTSAKLPSHSPTQRSGRIAGKMEIPRGTIHSDSLGIRVGRGCLVSSLRCLFAMPSFGLQNHNPSIIRKKSIL